MEKAWRERVVCNTNDTMAPTERVITFRPDEDILTAMEKLRDEEGIPFSQQIRRALREWLVQKGVMQSARKRAATRKRS